MLEKKNDENGEMIGHYQRLYKDFMEMLKQENPSIHENIKR
jgi:hypothetical protein